MTRSYSEKDVVKLRSNWLTVNGRTLRADVLPCTKPDMFTAAPRDLENVLILGRRSIVRGIEDFYEQQVAKNPGLNSMRPSIWTVQFGTTAQTDGRESQVFTERGHVNSGIMTTDQALQPPFRDYWARVKSVGFLPEVRVTSGSQDGGSWLLLRKPTLNQVLQHWLGQTELVTEETIERVKHDGVTHEREKREREVDRYPDAQRAQAQVGLMIAMAALKSALGDVHGYEDEIDSALENADRNRDIDLSTIRAIENSTYEMQNGW